MFRSRSRQGGFTLIELLIVVVIIGILAALAIPRFQAIAKKTEAQEAIEALRTGIQDFRTNQAAETGTPRWPTADELQTPGIVMENGIPKNPYQENGPDSILIATDIRYVDDSYVIKGDVVGDWGGYLYNPLTGKIWLNTKENGGNKW